MCATIGSEFESGERMERRRRRLGGGEELVGGDGEGAVRGGGVGDGWGYGD